MTMTFPMAMLPLALALTLFFASGGHNFFELSILVAAGSVCYVAEYAMRGSKNLYLRYTPFYLTMLLIAAVGFVYNTQWLVLGALGIVLLHLMGLWLSSGDDE